MAALLHAMVCHSVTTVHSCCVLRLAQLSVVCGRLAGCCSAAQPYSSFFFFKPGVSILYGGVISPGIGDVRNFL